MSPPLAGGFVVTGLPGKSTVQALLNGQKTEKQELSTSFTDPLLLSRQEGFYYLFLKIFS